MRASAAALALAACAPGHPPFPASGPDAAPDTLPPFGGDAAPSDVALTVTIGGVPAPDVAVVFQRNVEGDVVATVATDASGVAGAALGDGGFVTVIVPGGAGARLFTFAAVRAGDRLRLDVDAAPQPPTSSIAFSVPTRAGAPGYEVRTPCGSGILGATGTGTIELALAACGGTLDAIVVALDDNGLPAASLTSTGVTLDTAQVDIAGSYDALVHNSFAYSAVPAQVVFMGTYEAIISPRGRLVDGSAGAAPSGGAAASALDLPAGTGFAALIVSDGRPADGEHGEQLVFDWGPWNASYALAYSSALLRPYTSAPLFDHLQRAVTWDEGAIGGMPQALRTSVHVYRSGIPEGTSWSWSIVAPREAAPLVRFPQLPRIGETDFVPRDDDTVAIQELTSVAAPGGYDALRPAGFAQLQRLVTGASGRMVVQLPFTPDPL
jgi:hypothetical protein